MFGEILTRWEVRFRGKLSDKRVLVTGAGMGVGRGIALALAAEVAVVALHYAHSRDGAEGAPEEIRRNRDRAVVLEGDLRAVAECRRVVDEAARALGRLDILVNNSCVTRARSFLDFPEEVYEELFDLNMRATFFCSQQAVRHMVQQGVARS